MRKFLVIASCLLAAHIASAERAFQLSLVPDIALAPRGENIRGVALNIWGENQVQGLDLGFVNGLVGDSHGLSWSFLGAYAENYTGVLWGGFFVHSTGEVRGWQAGLVNFSTGSLVGLQSGFLNVAQDVRGVQLGWVNYTQDLYGVQIGLVNIVRSNPWFSEFPNKLATGFPFVNWSF